MAIRSEMPWSERETDFLKAHTHDMTSVEIGETLKRTPGAVRCKVARLGISMTMPYRERPEWSGWTEEQKKMAHELYGKVPGAELSRRIGKPAHTILHWALKHDVPKNLRACKNCGAPFYPNRTALFCSDGCRGQYWAKQGRESYCQNGGRQLAQQRRYNLRIELPKKFQGFSQQDALELLEQYRNNSGPLKVFASAQGHTAFALSRLFRALCPAEYASVVERKKAKPYQKGRNFEWRVKHYLEGKGYWVLRSPQSKSPADLVALKLNECLLVQCKINKAAMSKSEKSELCSLAISVGGAPILAYRAPGYKTRYAIHLEDLTNGQQI